MGFEPDRLYYHLHECSSNYYIFLYQGHCSRNGTLNFMMVPTLLSTFKSAISSNSSSATAVWPLRDAHKRAVSPFYDKRHKQVTQTFPPHHIGIVPSHKWDYHRFRLNINTLSILKSIPTPTLLSTFKSAPPRNKSLATSAWPLRDAHKRAVFPFYDTRHRAVVSSVLFDSTYRPGHL